MATFVINFKNQFAGPVARGEKTQTVRRHRVDGKRMRPGDIARLYTGLRTKRARLLRVVKIDEVHSVQINSVERCIVIDGWRMPYGEAIDFARADGFSNLSEMLAWFSDVYGDDFEGVCVKWRAEK